jgi:hypothetical protein
VRRGDKDQASPFGQLGWIQAFAIDRHRQQLGSGGAKHFSCAVILRVFNGYAVAALDEYPGNQIDGLLRTIDDDHFRRIARHAPRAPKMSTNGFAQDAAPSRLTILELADWALSQMAQKGPSPHLKREVFDGASTEGKIVTDGMRARPWSINSFHRPGGCRSIT